MSQLLRAGVCFARGEHPASRVAFASAASTFHDADMALFAHVPEREADLDFTPSFVELDLTYLVPAGATVKSGADADRTGVRIVVRDGEPARFLGQAGDCLTESAIPPVGNGRRLLGIPVKRLHRLGIGDRRDDDAVAH